MSVAKKICPFENKRHYQEHIEWFTDKEKQKVIHSFLRVAFYVIMP